MKHSKNHLTIHLYRKDEALASIRWAILSRNHTEAIFWGLELYDSNMEKDAIQALTFTWITCIGFGSLWCLESLQKLVKADRNEWCQVLMIWCRIPIHDTTAFHLLLRGASTPSSWQPRIVHTSPYTDPYGRAIRECLTTSGGEDLDDALYNTLRRGKLVDAWLMARAINTETQWSLIKQFAKDKKRLGALAILCESQLSDVEKRAAAFTLVSLDGPIINAALVSIQCTLPIEVVAAIESWDTEDSLRKRRVFKVRYEAITYLCDRSSQPVTESSEHDIQENLEKTLMESSYWQDVLSAHMKSTRGVATDTKMEEFYDIFFSYKLHDIPDEWSIADREKSHGRGLGKTDEGALAHFINTTVQRSITLGLWNSTISYSVPSLDWYQIYTDLHIPCVEALQLPIIPIQKQFEILC